MTRRIRLTAALLLAATALPLEALAKEFIGSAACAPCHQEEHARFKAQSKKAHSWRSVAVMLPKLTPDEQKECFACHTTGYGGPGGFVSFEATPGLAEVGCETCHGPGQDHAASGDPGLIRRTPTMDQCRTCHNPERVGDFNFKPLIRSGAH